MRSSVCWREIPKHYPEVSVLAFQVMPDHIHGILFVTHEIMLLEFSSSIMCLILSGRLGQTLLAELGTMPCDTADRMP